MRRLIAIAMLGAALCGCQSTGTTPSVTGTIRAPDVIYSNPGNKTNTP